MIRKILQILILAILTLIPLSTKAAIPPEELVWQALNVADFSQTFQIAEHPDQYQELNFLFGRQPNKQRVLLTGAAFAWGYWAVTDYIMDHGSQKQLTQWEQASIAVKMIAIKHNYSIGLQVRF